jgi:ketosteroid isomerase-like protein
MSSSSHESGSGREPGKGMRATARLAGFLYLVIIALGLFSEVVVRGGIIVSGDAAATAANIAESGLLFRMGVVSDLVVFLCDVAVAVLLYVLLRPAGETASLVAAGFRITGTAIYGVNLLNQLAAILLLGGAGYLAAFDLGQLEALALFFLQLHGHGYDLGLVFFGLHCLVVGYLLWRSAAFPTVLGVLMALAGVGYLVGSFTLFLFPDYASAVSPVYIAPLVGELAFCAWLLVLGFRTVGRGSPGRVVGLVGWLSAGMLLSLATPAPAQVEDVAEQVRAREIAFARTMADRDLEAFLSFVSPEAVFFSDDGPLRGREAIVRAWSPYFAGPDAPFSWHPDVIEVLKSGRLALSSGPVTGPSGEALGRFNSIWRKDADGEWRVVFDRGS